MSTPYRQEEKRQRDDEKVDYLFAPGSNVAQGRRSKFDKITDRLLKLKEWKLEERKGGISLSSRETYSSGDFCVGMYSIGLPDAKTELHISYKGEDLYREKDGDARFEKIKKVFNKAKKLHDNRFKDMALRSLDSK